MTAPCGGLEELKGLYYMLQKENDQHTLVSCRSNKITITYQSC